MAISSRGGSGKYCPLQKTEKKEQKKAKKASMQKENSIEKCNIQLLSAFK